MYQLGEQFDKICMQVCHAWRCCRKRSVNSETNEFIIYKKTKETASVFADLYAPMVHISVLWIIWAQRNNLAWYIFNTIRVVMDTLVLFCFILLFQKKLNWCYGYCLYFPAFFFLSKPVTYICNATRLPTLWPEIHMWYDYSSWNIV